MQKFLAALALLLLIVLSASGVAADVVLPPANWYAVVWVNDSDTLHWINPAGEQGSINRPQLPNEALVQGVHIAPNGRYLVVIGTLLNNNQALGIYDLQAGQFLAVHEAQPGEVIVVSEHDPIPLASDHFAAALHMPGSGIWRVIDFDLTTGAALGQLTSLDPLVPANFVLASWWPEVALYDVDIAIPHRRVHVRFNPPANAPFTATFPSLTWRPEPVPDLSPVTVDALPQNARPGFDIAPVSGQVAYGWYDPQFGNPPGSEAASSIGTAFVTNGDSATNIFTDNSLQPQSPRWLNGLQWLGFRVSQQPFQPHWTAMPAAGPLAARIPLGPNIGDLHGTPDGYLAVDYNAGQIFHMTQFQVEAFAAQFGNPVFQMNQKSDFKVVYVTPTGAQFALPGLATPGVTEQAADDLQAPPANCPGAPAPRLTVGNNGRVTLTDGTPLRVRNAPAGEILTTIPEGTVFNVLAGPACADGYLWWQIQLDGNQSGWSAEGDADGYFMEPFVGIIVDVLPTATPVIQVNPQLGLAPTNTPSIQVNPQLGLAPTSTPVLGIVAVGQICTGSPASRLQVGATAQTMQPSGTLAVYQNADSPTPFQQLATGINVQVIGGPQCSPNNLRMWRVQAVVNGQSISGWVAEGFQQIYYLDPLG
jgi:hypothetical protein